MERFNVVTGRKGKDNKTYWTRLGVAFPTQNGGFSLVLDAMPASDGGQYRMVMFPAEDQQTQAPRAGAKPTRRGDYDAPPQEEESGWPRPRRPLHDEMDDEIPFMK